MGLTVREALNIYPFSTVEIMGGSKGLDRPIRYLNIMEIPDVAEWLRGGELLFTSGFAVRSSPDMFVPLIEKLAERGVAALAIRPSTYLPEISKGMIETSERVGLPLLKLTRIIPYMDYMEPLLEVVINEQLNLLKSTEGIHNRLLESMLNDRGLTSIITALEKIIKIPVCIIGSNGILFNKEEYCTQEHRDLVAVFQQNFKALHLNDKPTGKYFRIEIPDKGVYGCVPIPYNTKFRPVMMTKESDMIKNEISILAQEHAATLIAVELMNEDMVNKREQQIRGDFLEELIEGRNLDAEVMQRRASYMGIFLDEPYCVFLLGINPKKNKDGLSYDDRSLLNIKQRMQERLETAFQYTADYLLLSNKGDDLLGLVGVKSLDEKQMKQILASSIEKMRLRYPDLAIVAGCSDRVIGAEKARDSYEQALLAQNITNKFFSATTITTYRELGIFRFLDFVKDDNIIENYITETLGNLLKQKSSAELLDTLRAYYLNEQNVSKTARALFVHKNTVIYRLQKVEELLELQLTDYDKSFNIQFCLKAIDMLKGRRMY